MPDYLINGMTHYLTRVLIVDLANLFCCRAKNSTSPVFSQTDNRLVLHTHVATHMQTHTRRHTHIAHTPFGVEVGTHTHRRHTPFGLEVGTSFKHKLSMAYAMRYTAICSSIKNGTAIPLFNPLSHTFAIHHGVSAAVVFNLRPKLSIGKSYKTLYNATNVHMHAAPR